MNQEPWCPTCSIVTVEHRKQGHLQLSVRALFFVEKSFLTVWNETHYYQLTCCEPISLAELSIIIHP